MREYNFTGWYDETEQSEYTAPWPKGTGVTFEVDNSDGSKKDTLKASLLPMLTICVILVLGASIGGTIYNYIQTV